MQTITFYSYKGGSGRSLVVANVARYLARFGQKVVAIDFDLEAPGLPYKFYLDAPEELPAVSLGLVDYIYTFVTEGRPARSLKKFVSRLPASPDSKTTLHLMPAGAAPSAEYWRKLSCINWHELLYAPGAPGVHFFLELKERIRAEYKPDFLLIDARTGITESGGIATTILPEKLVCFLSSSRENLDGARAVLRSLRRSARPPDAAPIEVIPALSRIPTMGGSEQEQLLLQKVRKFLNEDAERIEDTLNVGELFVLHSEPELQVAEQLRIGGEKSPEESVLLRDYLRLFARLIPKGVVEPHIDSLIHEAEAVWLDNPDATQKDLESLAAYLGHPQPYRELLKFYRVRNEASDTVLRTAKQLWDIERDATDPLLWSSVQRHFEEVSKYSKLSDPSLLPFVEAVWRAAGADDMKVGCDLAESYDNFKQGERAADLLLELVEAVGPNDTALSRCLRQVTRVNRFSDAERLIDRHHERLAESEDFFRAWVLHALARDDNKYVDELVNPPWSGLLYDHDPRLAYKTLMKAGRTKEARNMLQPMLDAALRSGPSSRLMNVAEIYAEVGLDSEFRAVVRNRLPPEDAEHFLADVAGRIRGRAGW